MVFLGFPPRKGRERKGLLDSISGEPSTFVLFESPHRLAKTLGELPPEAPVAVCRELTKLHEEVFRGTAGEAAEHFSGTVKGEIVLVVRGGAGARRRASRRPSRWRGGTWRRGRPFEGGGAGGEGDGAKEAGRLRARREGRARASPGGAPLYNAPR